MSPKEIEREFGKDLKIKKLMQQAGQEYYYGLMSSIQKMAESLWDQK